MLVLSRRFGEDIVIGEGEDAVTVRLLRSKGGQIKVGVEAPPTVPVRRGELPPIMEENREEARR